MPNKIAIAAVLALVPFYWWGATAQSDGVVAGDAASAKTQPQSQSQKQPPRPDGAPLRKEGNKD